MAAVVFLKSTNFSPILSLIVSGTLLSACSIVKPVPPTALEPPPKAISPTPTFLMPPTPFQGGKVWLSPDLPASFLAEWEQLSQNETGLELVLEADQAQVRIAPGEGSLLSTWVYALVAPFPTIPDGLSWEAVQSLWSADDGQTPLYVGTGSLQSMEYVLGPKGSNVRVAPDARLLDVVWDQRDALALVPFEALEPQWKVLAIDGLNPIQKSFDLLAYPLKLEINVASPEGTLAWLAGILPTSPSNYEPEQMTTLVMTGVTALTRATAWQMERRGISFPAELIGEWLEGADITHISNEVAFADDCPEPDPVQEGLKFCSDPAYIQLLENIGTDLVELTGNHVRDYGSDALRATLDAYDVRGWGTFGGGMNLDAAFEPFTVEHNGNRLAFIGCNYAGPKFAWATATDPGSTPCDEDRLFPVVTALSEEGFLVIFTYQWAERGAVYEDQREAFERAVEAGAVIVSGSQAHQPLGMAFYEDGFIHYGLGNLFFDQMQSLALRSELIDRHVFYQGRHISTELLTAMLESYAQPRPMNAEERSVLLESVFDDSGW